MMELGKVFHGHGCGAMLRRSMHELNIAEQANGKPDRPGDAMEPKHSGLGIASFIISIVAGLSIFAIIDVTQTRCSSG
jgi:hypothetical protein